METKKELKEISHFILSFGLIMPRMFAVISITTTSVGIFLIIAKSPKNMANYKYALFIMMLVSFQFDMVLSVFAGPIPLPGAAGLLFIGILAELFPSQGNMLIFLIILTFYLEILVIFLGFVYREYILLRATQKTFDNVKRFFPVLPFVIFGWIITPAIFFQITTPDSETRYYMMNELKQDIITGAAIFLVHPNHSQLMLMLSSMALIMVFTVGFFIQKSIRNINNYLTENSAAMSTRSFHLQKMLLRALIFQTVIPFLFLIFPCIILYAIVCIAPLIMTVPNDFAQQMTAVVFTTPAFYSPARVSCMIYFTTPYKEYVLKVLRIKSKTISNVPVTSTFGPSATDYK